MSAGADIEREISASMLRLRGRAPFFATLALYARIVVTDAVPTAATDGQDVLVNPAFMAGLSTPHLDGVIVHEVLHAALGHVGRRAARDPERWNIAADIVVNGILTANGFELPEGAVRDGSLQDFSVEEVYALLERRDPSGLPRLVMVDLLEPGADGAARAQRARQLERHWAGAVDRAVVVARTAGDGDGQGPLPGGVVRAFGLDQRPRLDWRTLLWRFLTRTPTDFAAFDRRLVHRGLYLETLESTSVRVHVAIDTSGSVSTTELDAFGAELQALLASYPGIEATLVYADAGVHGPYPLTAGRELPPPVGGGGTDFRPFFALVDDGDADATTVAVYLTDGHGDFPVAEPAYPVLWVVTPGGLDDEKFPWGTVVRMV